MERAMKFRHSILALIPLFAVVSLEARQEASLGFAVRHKHRWGSCEGALRVSKDGVGYETAHQKHARTWSFRDIRHADFRSKTRLALRTYGAPETWHFHLREGDWSPDAYRLLARRVERGVTSRILYPATTFLYELPVRHRHLRGGCEGTLRIGLEETIYDTQEPKHRRIWRSRDLRSFGSAGPHDLRLTTEEETFTFDLKQPLQKEVYDHLWKTTHEKGTTP
ncbi:MAG: hypothetical protein ACREUU_03020 [Gammaproteobacteria bacterium]